MFYVSTSCQATLYVCFHLPIAMKLAEATVSYPLDLSGVRLANFGGFFTLASSSANFMTCSATTTACTSTSFGSATASLFTGDISYLSPWTGGSPNPLTGYFTCPRGTTASVVGQVMTTMGSSLSTSTLLDVYACLQSSKSGAANISFDSFYQATSATDGSTPSSSNKAYCRHSFHSVMVVHGISYSGQSWGIYGCIQINDSGSSYLG